MEPISFPILQLQMNEHGLKISLSDDHTHLAASLPKGLVESIVQQWQEFQNGTAKSLVLSRHYAGEWPNLPGSIM